MCARCCTTGVFVQKARLVSDHLDAAKRLAWLQDKWPVIVRAAKRCTGLILCEDEASCARWGSLSYTGPDGGTSRRYPPVGSAKATRCLGPLSLFRGVCSLRALRAASTRKVSKGSCRGLWRTHGAPVFDPRWRSLSHERRDHKRFWRRIAIASRRLPYPRIRRITIPLNICGRR